jgi:hypothetical protein
MKMESIGRLINAWLELLNEPHANALDVHIRHNNNLLFISSFQTFLNSISMDHKIEDKNIICEKYLFGL